MRKLVAAISIFCACSVFGTGIFAQTNAGEQKKFSAHYYKRYAEFEKGQAIGKQDIVFLGNSLTEGGKWNEYFQNVSEKLAKRGGAIRNCGIIGDDAVGMYERLHQILPGTPKKIFLLVGVNDISHNLSADSVLVLVDKVIGKIKRESPKTKLYLQSLLPINSQKNKYKTMIGKAQIIKEVNAGLEQLTKKYKIPYIELYNYFTTPGSIELREEFTSDGLHINSAGYEIWVREIKKYVK
ncbi:MAG: GDSL-type esterase/lipase family protein [Bacteroidales bacterium]